MKVFKQSVGIDISKDSFNYYFGFISEKLDCEFIEEGSLKNNKSGASTLIKKITKRFDSSIPIQFVMEATGVYHELLAHSLHEQGYVVSIILPSKAKAFIQSINQRAKTDKIDAKNLCRMGLERKLDKWQPADSIYIELRALTRERESLLKEKTIILNKIHAIDTAHYNAERSKKRLTSRLELIIDQVTETEDEISEVINSQESIKAKVNNIAQIKGITETTIAIIIAETNGFNLIRNQKQLVGYAGLDVRITQSGNSFKSGGITKKGNAHIRKALYMPALSASKHNHLSATFYEQLKQRQGAKKQGIIAVAKKLLLLIYALWKNETQYDPGKNVDQRLALNK